MESKALAFLQQRASDWTENKVSAYADIVWGAFPFSLLSTTNYVDKRIGINNP